MDNGPVAVELSKLIAERAFDVDLNSILEFSLLAQEVCARSQDLVALYQKKRKNKKEKSKS
ncbi:MAG: hypothetical protein Q6352_005125 [Candidatus Freyrarchaeum guaymaensis]